jgi:hypothetical protein
MAVVVLVALLLLLLLPPPPLRAPARTDHHLHRHHAGRPVLHTQHRWRFRRCPPAR